MTRILTFSTVSLFLLLTTTPKLPAQDFEALAKEVAQELAGRRFDKVESRFDAAMASAMPLEKLQSFWDSSVSKAGAFEEVTKATSVEYQGYHVVMLTCAFEKTSLGLRLTFAKDGKLAGFYLIPAWSPPDYANSSAFHERSVTVGATPWQLPGTLTEPNGAGPFPAIVLVHGSGAHDEDETIGPNKPFKDLAWGLASRGIAVLRYEKRTHKYADQLKNDVGNLTVKEEVTDDAQAAAALLAAQPEIQKTRIYVLGHSLGGMLAPRIAEGDARISGLIIMAGSTRPLGRIVVEQIKYLSTLSGPVGDGAQKQIEAAGKFAQDYDSPTLKPGETVSMMGIPLPASYVLDLRSYDPGATAARLKIPILVIQGESDYQVTLKDFEGWQRALAGHSNVTMKTYPGLCHLFTPGGSPPSPADYNQPGHVDKHALDDIANWVEHGGLK
jgi:uncharacterized protein